MLLHGWLCKEAIRRKPPRGPIFILVHVNPRGSARKADLLPRFGRTRGHWLVGPHFPSHLETGRQGEGHLQKGCSRKRQCVFKHYWICQEQVLDPSSAIIEAPGDGKTDGGDLAQEEQGMRMHCRRAGLPEDGHNDGKVTAPLTGALTQAGALRPDPHHQGGRRNASLKCFMVQPTEHPEAFGRGG